MNATDDGDQPLGESPDVTLDLSFDNAGRHVPMHLNLGPLDRVAEVQQRWGDLIDDDVFGRYNAAGWPRSERSLIDAPRSARWGESVLLIASLLTLAVISIALALATLAK